MKGILLMKEGFTGSLLLSTLLILAGCSLAPKYEVPSTPTIATFKEAPQQPLSPEDAGTWKTAQPSEDTHRNRRHPSSQSPRHVGPRRMDEAAEAAMPGAVFLLNSRAAYTRK